jgi:peptidoglycan-associated lipoprotein
MIDNPYMKIELGSHTDSRGKAVKNQTLSENRAKAAVDYIISKGISPDRITAKGYGESKLLIPDSAFTKFKTEKEFEDAHQLNRRTEFRVVSLK